LIKRTILILALLLCQTATSLAASSSWLDNKEDFSLMSLPDSMSKQLQKFYNERVQAILQQYAPAVQVLRKTWDKKTMEGIMSGRVAVPDATINDALAKKFANHGHVKSLSITSLENGRMAIHLDTKDIGRVELIGTIDRFVHKKDISYMTFTVEQKKLVDHIRYLSWIFSRMSLSLMEKLTGEMNPFEELPLTFKGNTVKADFSQKIKSSDLAKTTVLGYNLADSLQIDGAVPHKDYVEFQTNLQVPDDVKNLILRALQ
jgi:hypothetical protein